MPHSVTRIPRERPHDLSPETRLAWLGSPNPQQQWSHHHPDAGTTLPARRPWNGRGAFARWASSLSERQMEVPCDVLQGSGRRLGEQRQCLGDEVWWALEAQLPQGRKDQTVG